MTDKIYLTPTGKKIIDDQIIQAQQLLKVVQGQKTQATEIGGSGSHDNFVFEDIEREERELNSKIERLNELLSLSSPVGEPSSDDSVDIGHRVQYETDDGEKKEITITGFGESDPSTQKIAYNTPLGQALLGAKKGEQRSFTLNHAAKSLKIKKITRA